MSDKSQNNRKKAKDEEQFENELKKLKLSAEFGATFSEEEKPNNAEETEAGFLERMREFEESMNNPDESEIREALGFPKFPKVSDLNDDQVKTALELARISLRSKKIELDVIYPTPDREIYRFITEELMKHKTGMAGAGGMTMHFIYEEFYPNPVGDIKEDLTDTLHFLCRGYKAHLPWRIANNVKLHGKKVSEEIFRAHLDQHRQIFKGMSFIGVDSIETDVSAKKAHAKAQFRFYLDNSSGQPGEVSADAEFFFDQKYDNYCLTRLVIGYFGIK